MTEQTITNRLGDELLVVHHDDADVPGTVELRLDEDAIHLDPAAVAELGLVLAPVVVGPDDHLVLKLPDSMTGEAVQDMAQTVLAGMPGLKGRVLFLGGEVDLAIVRPGQEVPR